MNRGGQVRRSFLRTLLLTAHCSLLPILGCFGNGGGGSTDLTFKVEFRADSLSPRDPDSLEILIYSPDARRSPVREAPDCSADPADPLAGEKLFRQSFEFKDREARVSFTAPSQDVDIVLAARSGDQAVFVGGKRVAVNAGGVTDAGTFELREIIAGAAPAFIPCQGQKPGSCLMGRTKAVDLAWDPIPAATHYWVCARKSDEARYTAFRADSAQMSFPPKGSGFSMEDDAEYTFKLLAVNDHQTSLFSEEVVAKTIQRPSLPTAKVESTTIVVTIPRVELATSYRVYYDTDGPGEPYEGRKPAATVDSPLEVTPGAASAKIEASVEGARMGAIYFLAVSAVNEDSKSESFMSPEIKVPVPYAAPKNLKAIGRTGRVELSWDPLPAELTGPGLAPPGSLIEAGSQPRFAVFYGTEPPSKDDDNNDGVEAAEGASPIYVQVPIPTTDGAKAQAPELVVSGLENGKTHYFAVKTQNDFTQSVYSDEVSAVPLAVPANLQATTFGDLESKSTAIEFTFDKVDKAAAYRIFASASPPASAPALAGPRAAFPAPAESILGAPVMTIDSKVCTTNCKAKWTGVTPNTAYKLGVTAAISTVSESDLPPAKSLTSAPASPVIVTPSTPTLGAVASTGRVLLNWASVAGAIGYKVHYNAATGGEVPAAYVGTGATNGNSPVAVSGTSLTLKGLTDAKDIFIAVSAFSASGESNLSNEVVAVPLAVPTGLGALTIPNSLSGSHVTGRLLLRWNPVEKANCYKLQYGAAAGTYTSSILVSQEKDKTFAPGSLCAGATNSVYWDQAECAAARCAMITGLTNTSARHFVVSALRDGSGVKTESDLSASFSATPIAKPTNFVAKGRTSRVELSWTAVTGAVSGYEVRWSDTVGQDHLAKPPNNVITSACTAVTLCAAAGTPGCAVTASGICPSVVALPSGATFPANGTTNTFSIAAMNASGRSDQSDDDATPLAAPVMSGAGNAKDMDDVRLVFEWQRGVCPLAICPSYGSCATGEACPTYKVGYDTASRAGTLKISDYKGTGATEGSSTLANTSCMNGGINERCQINGLQTNTSYYLSAAATTTSGDESDPMTEVAMSTLLGQVQNLKVTMGTAKAVLTWDPVAKATAYDVIFEPKAAACPTTPGVFSSPTTTGETVTGLTNGTRYCFSVEAKIAGATCQPAPAPGANSPTNNCGQPMTNLEGIPIPAATTLVEPTYVGGTDFVTTVRKDQFTVKWTAPAVWPPPDSLGIDKFRFYYDTDAPGAPYNGTGATQGNSPIELKPGDLGCAPTCTYTLSGLQPNTTYYYTVASANTKGDTDGFSLIPAEGASGPFAENGESDLLIPAGLFIRTLLPDLQNLKVTTTTDQATASWSAVTGAAQYRLYYLQHFEDNPTPATPVACPAVDIADDLDHTDGDGNPAGTDYSTAADACSFPSGTIVSSTSKTLTCMKNAGFMTGTNDSYCFRVVAESASGVNHSDFSTPQVASPLKIPGCFAAVVGGTQIQLSWCAVARATGYRIYYDTNSGTPYSGTNFLEGASPIVVSGQATASATVNLPAGTPPTTFYFTLTAIRDANADGDTIDSGDGESVMAPELTTQSSLATPGNFTVVGQTGADTQDGVVETFLNWDAVTGASCYRVFYDSDTAGAPYVEETTEVPNRVAATCEGISATCESLTAGAGDPCSAGASSAGGLGPFPSTKTDLILTGLDFGIQYHFAVRAYTTTSSSPYTSNVALIPLGVPTVTLTPILNGETAGGKTCPAVSPTTDTDRKACIVVQWTAATGAGSYSVYYDEDSGSPPFTGTAVPPTSGGPFNATCTSPPACGCEGIDSAADPNCDGEIANIPSTSTALLLSGLTYDQLLFIAVQAVGPATEDNRGDLSTATSISTTVPAPTISTWTITAIGLPLPTSSTITLSWSQVDLDSGPPIVPAPSYEIDYTRETDDACPNPPPGSEICTTQLYSNTGGLQAGAGTTCPATAPTQSRVRCGATLTGTLGTLNTDTIGSTDAIYHVGVRTRGYNTPDPTPSYFPYSRRTLDAERPTFSSQPVSVDSTGAAKSLFKGGETKNGTHPGDAACHTGETTTVNPATDCDLTEDVIILNMTVRDYIHKLSSGNVARFTADFSAIDDTAAAGTAVPACASLPSCSGTPPTTAAPGVGIFKCEYCPVSGAGNDERQYWIRYRINTASTIADNTGAGYSVTVTANDQRNEANTGAGNSRQSSNVSGLKLDNTRPTLTSVTAECPAGTPCLGATTGQTVTIKFQTNEAPPALPLVTMGSRTSAQPSPTLVCTDVNGSGSPCPATPPGAGPYNYTYVTSPAISAVIDGASGTKVLTVSLTDAAGNDAERTGCDNPAGCQVIDFELPAVCSATFTAAGAPTSPNLGYYNDGDKIRLAVTAGDPGTGCPAGTAGLTVRADFNAIDSVCDGTPGPDGDPCRVICTTGAGGACPGPIEYQISAGNTKIDGSYSIEVTATDFSGITSPTNSFNATLDNIGPVVTAVAPGDTANQFKTQNSGPINVTWTTTETNKDTALVELYSASGGTLQGVIEAASSGNDDGTTSWAAAPNPELSTLRIGITATDKAGNQSNGGVETLSANDFTLDNTNPTVAISVATPGETAGNVVRGTKPVDWATTDANVDQAEIRYSTDNTTCNLGTFSSVILPFAGGNDDGTENWATPATDTTCANWNKFCLKISVKDKAGNSGLAYSTNPFTVDNTGPVASISGPLPGNNWGNTPAKNITWTAAAECNRDAVNPVVQIYRDEGTLTYPFTESGGTADTGTFAWTLPSPKEVSTSRLRIVLADKAGNSSGNVDMVGDFTIDTINPSLNVVSPNGTEVWKGTQTINWGVTTDANPDKINLAWTTDGAATCTSGTLTTFATGIDDTGTNTFNWDTTSVTSATGYRIRATATDKAGNTNCDFSDSAFTVDNVGPSGATVTVNGGATFTSTALVTVAITGATENPTLLACAAGTCCMQVACDGAPDAEGVSTFASPTSCTIPAEGGATISVRLWDRVGGAGCTTTLDVGNQSAVDFTDAITLDTSGPTIGVVTPLNNDTGTHVDGTFDLEATVDDGAGSGVASCQYCKATDGLCNTEWAAGTVAAGKCSVAGLTCIDGNQLTLNIRSTDNTGTQSTATAVNRDCDNVAPATTDNSSAAWQTGDGSGNVTVTLTPTDPDPAGPAIPSGLQQTVYCTDTTGACAPVTPGTSAVINCPASSVCNSNYVRYQSNDFVGNTETVKTSFQIKIDRQAPTVSVAISVTNSTATHVGNPFDLSATFSDGAGSGLAANCERCVADTGVGQDCAAASAQWTTVGTTFNPGTGVCSITGVACANGQALILGLRADDSAGNTAPSTTTRTCDTAIPVTGTVNDGTGADVDFQSSTTTIDANWSGFTDAGSSIQRFEYSMGVTPGCNSIFTMTSKCDAPTSDCTTPTVSRTGLALVNGNTYCVKIRAVDNLGLTSGEVASDGVTIDTTAPGAPNGGLITVQSNAPASNDTVTGAATAVDAAAPATLVRIYSDVTCLALFGSFTANADGSWAAQSIGDNAIGTLYITAMDAAGNESACGSAVVKTNDITAPADPVAGNITVTQNTPPAGDDIAGAGSAVTCPDTVQVNFFNAAGCPTSGAVAQSTAVTCPAGSFATFTLPSNFADSGLEPDAVYVQAQDSAGNRSACVTVQNDITAPSCSVSAITEGTNPNSQHVSGTTLYYNTAVAGDFTVSVTITDTGGSLEKQVAFPNLTPSGGTLASTGGTDATPPSPFTNVYSWNTSDNFSASANATASDNAGNTGTCSFTVTRDVAAPSGDSLTVTDGFTNLTTTTITLPTSPTMADAASGLGTTTLQRREAVLTVSACGGPGVWNTLQTDPASPYVDFTLADAKCYEYQYLVNDNVSNQATYSSANQVKVDTSSPAVVTGNVTVSQNAPPGFDQIQGAVGAVTGQDNTTTVRFYTNSTCTLPAAPNSASVVVGDGSFPLTNLTAGVDSNNNFGDTSVCAAPTCSASSNLYMRVTDQAGNTSSCASKPNDVCAPCAPAALQVNSLPTPAADTVQGLAGSVEAGTTVEIFDASTGGSSVGTPATQVADVFGIWAAIGIGDNLYATVYVEARDTFGNKSTRTSAANDIASPPVPTIDSNPSDPSNSDSATFTYSNVEGGPQYECQLDANPVTSCNGGTNNYTTLANASHTFKVRAKDAAGNTSGWASYTWTVDTTPPTITAGFVALAQNAPGVSDAVSGATGAVSVGANETTAVRAYTTTTCTGAQCAEQTTINGDGSFPSFNIGDNSCANANGNTYIAALDAAGNKSTSCIAKANDIVAPETTIDSNPANPTNSTTSAFTFSSNEGGATFECRINGAGYGACVSPKIYDTPDVVTGSNTVDVRAKDAAQNVDLSPASFTWEVYGTAPGSWPVATAGATVQSVPALYDLDGNGTFETIVGADGGNLYVLNTNGTPFATGGWPLTGLSGDIRGGAAVGNFDTSDTPQGEIVFMAEGAPANVYFYEHDKTLRLGWPVVLTGMTVGRGVPAVGNIDADGAVEIVVVYNDGANTYVRALQLNGANNWSGGCVNVNGERVIAGVVDVTPALADIAGTAALEVVVGSNDASASIYVLDGADGCDVAGFPFDPDGGSASPLNSSPAVGDIGGETNAIVIGSDNGKVYAIRSNGTNLWGAPPNTGGDVRSSPAIGEVDSGSAGKEVVVGSNNGSIFVLAGANGAILGNYAQGAGAITSSPAIAHVNTDGVQEIVIALPNATVKAMKGTDGSTIGGWPLTATGAPSIVSSVAVGDVDADGRLDIAVGANDGKVWLFEAGSFAGSHDWPMFHKNPARTGN